MGAEPYNPATSLARDLLIAGAGRLRELNLSAAENQALHRIWEEAFQDLLELEQLGPKISAGLRPEDFFREFIRDERTADALLDLVFEERTPRLELLSQRFETAGLTASALPVDFKLVAATLTRGLLKAVVTEASRPSSPLNKHLSIMRPALVHSLLKDQTDTLEGIAATVTRLEQRLPAQAKYNVVFLNQATGTVIGDDARVRQDQRLGTFLEQALSDIKAIAAAGSPLKSGIDTLVELLGGISGISADYAGRIKNFLIEYLGTPDKTVPFGGRSEQLTDLDDWLTNPAAPSYCLIAAEAGRGKSALLARWADSLVRRGVSRVIFIPISIRFNTAAAEVTFTAFAARLSEVYGEPVKWASLTSQQWREICLKYLSLSPPGDTPLLIILDGLDEASDWRAGPDLFPLAPPPGIRIIVSARYLAGDMDERGWLERLRWGTDLARTLPLPTLTREGVSEVLTAMGNPLDRLATQVDVIGELFRLSQGDPLLVRLYVEALLPYGNRAAAIRPDDLPSIQEGLAGYFERWWEDQRNQWEAQRRNELTEKEDVLKFLNVCASAVGPLTREDIAAVAGGNLTSGLRIKSVATDVARFVIGDGDRGYVFGHPRLGYFFWDQMTERERADWEQGFLNYGQRTLEALNARRLVPEDAPAYALRYYGAHLERARSQPAALWGLVSEGWLHAWYALEGSYAGFLNDTERAWRAAENLSTRRGGRGMSGDALAVQFQSALCHASVTALSVGIPIRLLALAKEHGVLTPLQSLVLARQIPDEKICADALTAIAPGLPEWLQEDVLAATQRFESETTRAWTLGRLAPHLSNGLRQLALESARSFLNPRARALALCEIAPYLAAEVCELTLREAVEALKEIEDVRAQSRALSSIAARLSPNSALVNELLDIAEGVEDAASCARAFASIVPLLSSPRKEEVLTKARLAAYDAADLYSRALLLARLIPLLEESERSPLASYIFLNMKILADAGKVSSVMSLIAPYLPQHHVEDGVERASGWAWRQRLRVSEPQHDDYLRFVFFRSLEHIRLKLGVSAWEFRRLLEQKVGTQLYDANVELLRGAVISLLSEFGRPEDAPHLTVNQARELDLALHAYYDFVKTIRILELPTLPPIASSMSLLLPYLPAPLREDACSSVLDNADTWAPDTQAKMFAAMAAHLPPHLLDKALAKLKALDPSYEQVRGLAHLLPHLPADEMEEMIPSVVEIAAGLADESERARALTELAGLSPDILDETSRREILRKALEAAQAINDKREALQFSINMTKALSGERRAAAMERVLEQVFQLQKGEDLTALLQDILPSLPSSLAGRALDLIFNSRDMLDADTETGFILGLLPRLPETHRGKAVEELVARLKTKPGPQRGRAWLAGELFNYFSPVQVRETLETARANWSPGEYLSLAAKSPRHLPKELREATLREVLQMAGEVLERPQGVNLLVQVVDGQQDKIQHDLVEGLLAEANAAANRLYPWTRIYFSLRLMRHMSETSRRQRLQELFTTPESLSPHQWVEVYRSTARYIPVDLLPVALATATAINETESRARALTSLLPHLGDEPRGQALRTILDSLDELLQGWDTATKILARIAPYVPEDEKLGLVRSILKKGATLGWGLTKVLVLRAPSPYLSEDRFVEALRYAQSITRPLDRVEAYTMLFPHLPEGTRDEVLKEALDDLGKLVKDHDLVEALTLLGPSLPDEIWKARAMEVALKAVDGSLRASALAALAPFLPDPLKVKAISKALEAVNNIQERGPRTRALTSLAAHIPPSGGLLQESTQAVLSLRFSERLQALRALAPRLSVWASAQPESAYVLWNACMRAFSQHARPAFFNEVSPLLSFTLALAPDEEKEDTILSILRAGQDVTNWWP